MDTANLSMFAVAVLVLLMVPGPNMIFVISHGVAHGWRGALAAALGIALADLVMAVLVSAGVGALIMSWPPAFEVIRWVGVAYLLWLAGSALKKPADSTNAEQRALASMYSVLVKAALNSLFNPKALLFFMVFLPQFVDPALGNSAWQLLVLGMLLVTIALLFHLTLGVFATALQRTLKRLPTNSRAGDYGLAVVMTALAARLIFLGRPQ